MKKTKAVPLRFIAVILFLFSSLLSGCKNDNEYKYFANFVENYDVPDYLNVFLEKGESVKLDFLEQFKDSGIDIEKIDARSVDTGVFTVSGDRITAVGTGFARLAVDIYNKAEKTIHGVTSAKVFVIDRNDENLKEVSTPEDLLDIELNKSGSYILKSDIDLKEVGNWTPIGDLSDRFTGTFVNPFGFKIKNLTIISASGTPHTRDNGLFGWTENSYIDGIILENVFIDVTDFDGQSGSVAGGIAAGHLDSVIRGCAVDGVVMAQDRAGGIIGGASWGSVIGCTFNGSVISTEDAAGGIAGNGYVIRDCAAEGTVESAFSAGGVMGFSPVGNHVKNSTFSGEVSGDGHKGEIAGYWEG